MINVRTHSAIVRSLLLGEPSLQSLEVHLVYPEAQMEDLRNFAGYPLVKGDTLVGTRGDGLMLVHTIAPTGAPERRRAIRLLQSQLRKW